MSNNLSDDITRLAYFVLSGGKKPPEKEVVKEEIKKDPRVLIMEDVKFYLDMSQSILDKKFGHGFSEDNPEALNKLTEISLQHDIETSKLKVEKSRNNLIDTFVSAYCRK